MKNIKIYLKNKIMKVIRTTEVVITGEDLIGILKDKKLIAGNEQISELKVKKGDHSIRVVLELPANLQTISSVKNIENLSISARLRSILNRENFANLDKVATMTEAEFSKIQGVGNQLLNEMISVLNNHNLGFKK